MRLTNEASPFSELLASNLPKLSWGRGASSTAVRRRRPKGVCKTISKHGSADAHVQSQEAGKAT